jgi:phthiocerol/phenolphthiocerol synthesis type-I polyketide synthase E
LVLSARSAESLQQARSSLADELSREADVSLADVAFTLEGRRAEDFRLVAVVHDQADAVAVLGAAEHDNVSVGQCPPDSAAGADRVAFLFPGQGAQHVGMARGLYDTEPVFRQNFDRCAEGFATELGIDLAAQVFDGETLEPTDLAQPALFAVEYALAELIMSYGVTPAALAGQIHAVEAAALDEQGEAPGAEREGVPGLQQDRCVEPQSFLSGPYAPGVPPRGPPLPELPERQNWSPPQLY